MLLLNTPHNPTGRVLDRAELELIAARVIEHDLVCISDEVYEHLVYDGEHVPIATLPGMAERTLTISSVGKSFSFTGWKIGWCSGPAELVAATRTVKQFLTFAGGTPLQHAAAAALRLAPRSHLDDAARRAARAARPAVRRARRGRPEPLMPAGHLLRQRRRRHRRRQLLRRAARALRRRRDPDERLLRRQGAARDARPLRVLQARGGHRRGGAAAGRAAHLDAALSVPAHWGARFSAKARTPSRKSPEEKHATAQLDQLALDVGGQTPLRRSSTARGRLLVAALGERGVAGDLGGPATSAASPSAPPS